MSIDEEIKIKQNAQAYYEKDLSYNQLYRQGVIDGYAKGIDEFAERLLENVSKNYAPGVDFGNMNCYLSVNQIKEIAEEMKAGTQ